MFKRAISGVVKLVFTRTKPPAGSL